VFPVVALRDGGWLAVGNHMESPGIRRYSYLLRSQDGVRWNVVHADRCGDDPPEDAYLEGVTSWYSDPVPLGDRWVVTHSCSGEDGSWSELYLLDEDGADPQRIIRSEDPGLRLDQPVAVGAGDAVVVPERDNHGFVTLLQLTLPEGEPSADEVG
jgi:hypothetical protein